MSKLIDITGQTFYELTVVSKAKSDKNGRTMWNCICSCGRPVIARGYDLKNGKHKSCGHTDKIRYKYDLTGKQFGDLDVLYRNEDGTWRCKCSCGNFTNVSTYALTSGTTKGCGHSRKFIDLTGQKFGEWEVLRYLGESFWECRCSCGNISKVHSYSLRNGKTLSCGHKRVSRQLEDLTDKRFSEWTVIEYVGGRHSLWKCKCSCGTIQDVAAYDLKNGNSKSCGHNSKLPKEDLTGKHFGQLTVLEYLGKGKYRCQCSCGNITEVLGNSLKSGNIIGCGCQQKKTKYTKEYLESCIVSYIAKFGEKPFITDLADLFGVTSYYIGSLLTKYDLRHLIHNAYESRGERDVFEFVQDIAGNSNVISRDRKLLAGREIDIYIPDKHIGIEYNGNYWHREEAVGQQRHLDKTIEAYRAGVRLIHIFEYEWNDASTREKLKSLIKSAVAVSSNVYYARNCSVKLVSKNEEKEFLTKYHLQGFSGSSIAYGLYSNSEELLSLMSFGKPRFNDRYEWEVIRYCNRFDTAVVGGAEKLFKAFCDDKDPQTILTYTDISKFTGEVYKRLGFKVDRENITPPNYVWLRGNDVLTRYQTQKQKLLDGGLGNYGNTEDEIMFNLGYDKIYDCGNLRYTWHK